MADAKNQGRAGSLFFGMTLETSDFKKNLKSVKKFTKESGEAIRESFKKIAAGCAIVGAAFATVGAGLVLMTKATADAANEQFILAKSIDATVTELDGLVFATDALGVETNMTIDKMREAGGIEAFKKMADDVKGAGSELQQLAKAQELLGNEGLKLLPILQLGSDGLKAYEEQAIRTGNALPADKVAGLVLAWQEYEGLMQSISGIQKKLSAELALPVAELFNSMDQLATLLSGKLIDGAKNWANFIVDAIPVIAKNIFTLTDGFITWFNTASEGVFMLTEAMFGLESGGNRTNGVFETMGDLLATMPNQVLIVLKKVGALLLGTFQTIGNLFFRAVTEPIILALSFVDKILKKLGSDGFTGLDEDKKKIRDTFSLDLGKNIGDMLGAGGILDVSKLEKENEDIIADRVDAEEKFNKSFAISRKALLGNFDKLKEDVGKTGKTIVEATEAMVGINDSRASMVLTGSQEEARILAGQSKQELKVQQDIRTEAKKTNQLLSNLATT